MRPLCRCLTRFKCTLLKSQFSTFAFKLADIGEGISQVTIVDWHVVEGEKVQEYDKIADVRTDKAAVEITSPVDGTVKKIYYAANDVVAVGQVIVDFDVQEESSN